MVCLVLRTSITKTESENGCESRNNLKWKYIEEALCEDDVCSF